MEVWIATFIGAIAGGLTGGLIMYVILEKFNKNRQHRPGTMKGRILAYISAGILLGFPGGLMAEMLLSVIEK